MQHCDFIISATWLATVDASDTVISDGAIAISDGKILAVDTASAIQSTYTAKERVHREQSLLIPGLINT
ncbi:MAG: S-adenosylhomocysteine deaminase, partial [Pseudomonadota bacterium]